MERLLEYVVARDWENAWGEYQRLIGEGPASARLLLMGAHAAFGLRNLLEAKALAEQALSLVAEDNLLGRIRFHLGMVAREIGDTAVALDQFTAFLDELPVKYPELAMGEGKAHFYRALTLRQLRDYAEAETAYRAANDCFRRDGLNGLLVKGLQNVAWLYCLMDRSGDARACLEESKVLVDEPVDHLHQTLGEAYLALIEQRYMQAAAACEAVFRRAERGETVTPEERAQAAWLAGMVAVRQQRLESADALAGVALHYASEAADARLMNDAGALRREIELLRQVGA